MKRAVPWLPRRFKTPVSSTNSVFELSRQLWIELLLERFGRWLIRPSLADAEIEVWHHCDQTGTIWWSGYNPNTGQSIHKVSEVEIRRWLERR